MKAIRTSKTPVWSGRAVNWGMLAVAAALSALGAFILLLAGDAAGWGVLACGPLLCIWSVVRVTVSSEAVLLRFGLLPWPRLTVWLEEVITASVGHARPARYGGWGLRRASGGALTVLIRGGETLRMVKRDGRDWVVTVDDASAAVRAVRAQLPGNVVTSR